MGKKGGVINMDDIIDNDWDYKSSYNTYYIFQNNSGNPSGNYHINPYIAQNSIIVSDKDINKENSGWNFKD